MEKPTSSDIPMKATCHCGAISITVPSKPTLINECQCTICRRYAAAWAYYNTNEVKITTQPDTNVRKYRWGDRESDFCFCDTCGCVCYWWPFKRSEEPGGGYKMGVNTRMMDPKDVANVNRELDFNQLFVPLGSGDTAAHSEDLAKYGS